MGGKMKKILTILFLYPVIAAAQVPQPAYNPMTAPGAFGITSGHLLFWQNPHFHLKNRNPGEFHQHLILYKSQ